MSGYPEIKPGRDVAVVEFVRGATTIQLDGWDFGDLEFAETLRVLAARLQAEAHRIDGIALSLHRV